MTEKNTFLVSLKKEEKTEKQFVIAKTLLGSLYENRKKKPGSKVAASWT